MGPLRPHLAFIQAVIATYTHGLVVIVSTKKRYGGFAKAVGMRVPTTPHGLGYAATVIVVDATIPVPPDDRGDHSTQVRDLPETGEWLTRLQRLAARR